MLDTALKLDFSPGYGTFTSITDYNHTKEIDTGDAYDFRPVTTSVAYDVFFAGIRAGLRADRSMRARASSSTSRPGARSCASPPRWSAASRGSRARYFVHTERFISTGNLVDRGCGVPPVYYDAAGRSD